MTDGARYLKKPVPVEARQFHRYNGESIAEWIGGVYKFQPRKNPDSEPYIAIEIAGKLLVTEGEWVVKVAVDDEHLNGLGYEFQRETDADFQEKYTPDYPEPVGEHVAEVEEEKTPDPDDPLYGRHYSVSSLKPYEASYPNPTEEV